MIDEKELIRCLAYDMSCFETEDRKISQLYVRVDDMVRMIKGQPKIGEWIPCSERMPEEHDSIFTKFKGTDKWNSSMFEKISNDVNVTVEDERGERATMTAHTIDGKWKPDSFMKLKVIAWKPFPEPYQGNT